MMMMAERVMTHARARAEGCQFFARSNLEGPSDAQFLGSHEPCMGGLHEIEQKGADNQ